MNARINQPINFMIFKPVASPARRVKCKTKCHCNSIVHHLSTRHKLFILGRYPTPSLALRLPPPLPSPSLRPLDPYSPPPPTLRPHVSMPLSPYCINHGRATGGIPQPRAPDAHTFPTPTNTHTLTCLHTPPPYTHTHTNARPAVTLRCPRLRHRHAAAVLSTY